LRAVKIMRQHGRESWSKGVIVNRQGGQMTSPGKLTSELVLNIPKKSTYEVQ
jgi:hypothetical protein